MDIMIPVHEWNKLSYMIFDNLFDDYEMDTHITEVQIYYYPEDGYYQYKEQKFILISNIRTNSEALMVYLELWSKDIGN